MSSLLIEGLEGLVVQDPSDTGGVNAVANGEASVGKLSRGIEGLDLNAKLWTKFGPGPVALTPQCLPGLPTNYALLSILGD
jgi:hypothetical protein